MGIIIYSLLVILVFVLFYFSFRFYYSIIRLYGQEQIPSSPLPVSLVIALKDEAGNIPDLITNLYGLNYPEGKLEIILVDDDSTDNGYNLLLKLTDGKSIFKTFRAVNKPHPGKKGALAFGISKAINDIIMITDADCNPEKDWLIHASEKFSQGYDLVFGIAPFYEGTTVTNKISCFENLRNSILSFGLAGTGKYYTAAARNFGFRKDSFAKLKGYSNTAETLSGDDDLLIREAVKNKLKIGIMMSESSKVFSKSKDRIKDYFRQRSRHTKTSFYYLPGIKFLLALWHLTNLILLSALFLSFYNHVLIIFFLIKVFTDLFIVLKLQKIFGYGFKILDIFSLQIMYEVFLVINFINAAFRKDVWK